MDGETHSDSCNGVEGVVVEPMVELCDLTGVGEIGNLF